MNERLLARRNAEPAPLADVPLLPEAAFRSVVLDAALIDELRISSFFAREVDGSIELIAVIADDATSQLGFVRTRLAGDRFESLASECPQVQLFEREIAEQYGVEPVGHPWLKPVRFHSSWRTDHFVFSEPVPGVTNFFRVEGDEVHEVAVGPVHAGVIEPGHFRFQCHGEHVFHLEIALGYQHRGIERALLGGPSKKSIHFMETAAGDTTIGHALAYCQAVEALTGTKPPARAHVLRGIALELERLANHTGDLGALSGDVAYLPTAAFCGRIRGDYLNLTAELCGSRFGRGFVRPGGVQFDLPADRVGDIAGRLAAATRDAVAAVDLLWSTPTVMERFESTGVVEADACNEIGMVGVAARACGRSIDVRHDFPSGIFRFVHIPVMTAHYGDVNSRAFVRWLEIQRSSDFVRDQLKALPASPIRTPAPRPLAPDSIVASLTEGWRGEICHVAVTDAAGRFARYKITDPSFHNWFGLALALRNGEISDFPLCNKSFNLSYCGHDL
ncbi:MAG TPA: NADH-quinone oxidoreductase subunit C [Thermoanaerobaculia bacterium]|nr:NADH-quinone oxidoreductase subunit C [Thermoanaerobaculia bacterium]